MSSFFHRLKSAIVLGMGWRSFTEPGTPEGAGAQLPANLLSGLTEELADRYTIEEEIGSGGMALVFRAHDVKHDRQVALKVMRPELTSQVGRERFLREIKLAARLTHPHILPLYDSGEAAGLLYYVMPFIEGASLGERLRAEKQLSVEDSLEIARAVAAALDYAHRQDIVHRDIKPENIMIHDGVAMVTDFGIGKALSAAGADNLTQPGTAIGTPAYMSPEQIYGEADLDGRSDIYSLGCVLYQMLTGQQLFTGSTPRALLMHRATNPVPKLDFPDTVPSHVQAAVRSTLAEAPDDRPATGAQLAELLASATQSMAAQRMTPTTPSSKSIAVLPFANMSPDAEAEYFSDGITEEIINALAQLKDLHVAARMSSFAFKGKTPDVSEVGTKLNVATILEGSVRIAGNRLRVTAQLINVADGYHLWSERFDRNMDDVFAIQDEIATTIANRLEVTLAGGADEPLVKPPTGNREAYQLYLKGRHLWNRRTKEALEQAVEYFEQATKLDPEYALAYSGLADAYLLLGSYALMPREQADQRARVAAEKALELDETLAEAHTSRGQVLRRERDWQGEEREYLRAIELNPSYATAHQWYATLLVVLGRLDEALREIRRAEELDPLSHAISVTVGQVLAQAREYDAAIEQLHKTLELEPDFFSAYAWLAIVYLEQGKYEEALQAAQKTIELRPDHSGVPVILGVVYARSGQRDKALEIMDQLKERGADVEAIASLYASLGEWDRAFELLQQAVEEHSLLLFDLKVNPFFAPLRSDPRFDELLRRMNFPDE